jgi:DNA-directed RNA polymerase specialized sigma subunit
MKKGIITDKRERINRIISEANAIANDSERNIVHYLYVEKDFSLEDIGKALGITRQRINQKYPELTQLKEQHYLNNGGHPSDMLKKPQKEEIK